MDKRIVNKNILSVFVFSIFVFLALGSDEGGDTNDTKKVYQQATSPKLDYKADTSQIRSELQAKGYNVIKVDFGKNNHDTYYVVVYIDTKGNYDKEAFAIHRIMFDNAIADLYYAMISDYELQTAWSFMASRQTLSDFYSGKISEQEYIHLVKSEEIL
jgi:hypothetical protein